MLLQDTGIRRWVGAGTSSDYSLLPPQIWKRILQKRINKTKLKTELWKGFFLVRRSAYTVFPSEVLTLLLDIVWDCVECVFQWLQQNNCFVLYCNQILHRSARRLLITLLSSPRLHFPRKKGALFQQWIRKLHPPWVKGLCWIAFPN